MERYQVEDVSQYWPVYLSFERTIELLKEQGMEPGTCLAPEKVERITFDVQNYFYENKDGKIAWQKHGKLFVGN